MGVCDSDVRPEDVRFLGAVRAIAHREAASRKTLLAEGHRLRRDLDDLTYELLGICKDGGTFRRTRSFGAGLARHAAAVLLAASVSCCGACEYAPPPLNPTEDTDRDGLSDECELVVFGTNPDSADSDGDGVDDPDEDHDGDGLTNFQEQQRAGDGTCSYPPNRTTGGSGGTGE